MGQFSFKYHPQSQDTNSGIHHWPHFGRLACHPTPTINLCYFSHHRLLRVWLLAPPMLTRAGSAFHHNPTVGIRFQFAVYDFQFWDCAELCSQGGEVGKGTYCSPVHSVGLHQQFWNGPAGRNGMPLFFPHQNFLLLTICNLVSI
jgi:hypothetical protein